MVIRSERENQGGIIYYRLGDIGERERELERGQHKYFKKEVGKGVCTTEMGADKGRRRKREMKGVRNCVEDHWSEF